MVLLAVCCPFCQRDHIIKGGKTATGQQRYRCQSVDGPRRSFVLDPAYKGRRLESKQQVIAMSLNGHGIRDTARVLKISPTTVRNERSYWIPGAYTCVREVQPIVKPIGNKGCQEVG